MRRTALFAVVALVLIVATPRTTGSCILEFVNNYYSDNTYSTAVGWDDRDCSCNFSSGGTATYFRYHEIYNCDVELITAGCEEYVPGTGWVGVQCPDEERTAQGRLHIPVG